MLRIETEVEPKLRQRSIVPDPLEGIIEGPNRLERYRNFITNVLGKIWPRGESGEYGDDFYRATRYDRRFKEGVNQENWISGYSQFSPLARDPQNLTPEEFENLVNNLGTVDYVRLRSVPPQLLTPGLSAVSVGGSCALETNSVHTVNEIRAHLNSLRNKLEGDIDASNREKLRQEIGQYQNLMTDFVRRAILAAPTITHISGAILGGHDDGVHYLETDMWRERVETEYGLPHDEAVSLVNEAYQRIHEAIKRRSLLINPRSVILGVNFDELDLNPTIEQWLVQLGLEPNDHRVLEVMHTYVGPTQLELLKQALIRRLESGNLSKNEIRAVEQLMKAEYHVRGKQIDHLRWGSMNLPKDVLMNLREMTEEEKNKFLDDHAFKMGILVMQSVYQANINENTTSIAAGFADLPTFGNEVQHEQRSVGYKFKGSPGTQEFLNSVEQQLTNPARLNRFNIKDHLSLLERYMIDTITARKTLLQEMSELQQQLKPIAESYKKADGVIAKVNGQIAKYEENIIFQQSVFQLISYLRGETVTIDAETLQQAAKIVGEQRSRALANAQRKQEQNQEGLTGDDQADLDELPDLINALETVEKGKSAIVTEKALRQLQEVEDAAHKIISENEEQIKVKLVEREQVETAFQTVKDKYDQLGEAQTRLEQIKPELSALTLNYFPLSDNPFVHHAMQFLWDADFIIFMGEAVSIQERRTSKSIAKDESNEQMRQLMEKIYPKLEAYLKYLFGEIEYPSEFRFSRVLNN